MSCGRVLCQWVHACLSLLARLGRNDVWRKEMSIHCDGITCFWTCAFISQIYVYDPYVLVIWIVIITYDYSIFIRWHDDTIVLYCIVLYCIVLYYDYCTILYYYIIVLLYCTISYYILLYCIVLYCIVLLQYGMILYCIVLYCSPLRRFETLNLKFEIKKHTDTYIWHDI